MITRWSDLADEHRLATYDSAEGSCRQWDIKLTGSDSIGLVYSVVDYLVKSQVAIDSFETSVRICLLDLLRRRAVVTWWPWWHIGLKAIRFVRVDRFPSLFSVLSLDAFSESPPSLPSSPLRNGCTDNDCAVLWSSILRNESTDHLSHPRRRHERVQRGARRDGTEGRTGSRHYTSNLGHAQHISSRGM